MSYADDSAEVLVKQLVLLKFAARRLIALKKSLQQKIERLEQVGDASVAEQMADCRESALECKFEILSIGHSLGSLCEQLDAKASRQQVFEALGVNVADRDTEDVRTYGTETMHLISVLDLENSATKHDDIEMKPLKWCMTMAMINAISSNTNFAKKAHEITNEMFGGALGEYVERPLIKRLAGT